MDASMSAVTLDACSEEMRPEWYPLDKIPFDLMWLDDKVWFPHLLAGV